MRLPSFGALNSAMHIWAIVDLMILGIGAPAGMLEVPGEIIPDPLFFPGDPTTAAPAWVRIVAVLFLALVYLVPALWLVTVQFALAKRGSRILGGCILGFAFFMAIDAMYLAFENAPWEYLAGNSVTVGIAATVGAYLLLYARWIYALTLNQYSRARC